MKNLILLSLMFLVSCNVMKDIIGGDTSIDNEFFDTEEANLNHDLLAFWRLDENGSVPRIDSSGNGHDLSNNGAVVGDFETGRQSLNSVTFSGVIRLAQKSVGNMDFGNYQDFSISFWILRKANPGSNMHIYENDYISIISPSTGSGDIKVSLNGASIVNTAVMGLSLSIWNHIVVSVNRQEGIRIFLNGNQSHYFNDNSEGLNISNTYVAIGSQSGGGSFFFNGSIDNVGVWGRALNNKEINSLYQGSHLD